MRFEKHLGLVILALTFIQQGCIKVKNPYNGLAPGIWRAELKIDTEKDALDRITKEYRYDEKFNFDDMNSGELPFLMEVKYVNEDSFYIEIINGEERMILDEIQFGRSIQLAKDTLRIEFPLWQTHIEAIVEENVMEGKWVVDYKNNYSVPFVAYYGKDHRFTTLRKEPVMDISGSWSATFSPNSEQSNSKIAEFSQNGNHLTGTFRSPTGDYRFLEGTIQADKIYLSTFDGTHAFLFEGKIFPDSSIYGLFRSGKHYVESWSATPITKTNDQINKESTHDLSAKGGPIQFSFKDSQGQLTSLDEAKYADKVVILQVMGTWCPNCLDETNFLIDYLNNHQTEDLAIVGLAFERYKDEQKSLETLQNYKKRLGIPYDLLLAGTSTSKSKATEALPFLDEVIAYPTMLILDKNKVLRYKHVGFDGPATSQYETFKSSFPKLIEDIQSID